MASKLRFFCHNNNLRICIVLYLFLRNVPRPVDTTAGNKAICDFLSCIQPRRRQHLHSTLTSQLSSFVACHSSVPLTPPQQDFVVGKLKNHCFINFFNVSLNCFLSIHNEFFHSSFHPLTHLISSPYFHPFFHLHSHPSSHPSFHPQLSVIRVLLQTSRPGRIMESHLFKHLSAWIGCLDGWFRYKVARQASRYGHHDVSSFLFKQLTDMVTWWLAW